MGTAVDPFVSTTTIISSGNIFTRFFRSMPFPTPTPIGGEGVAHACNGSPELYAEDS